MNEQRDFARSVSGWLVERAGSNTPGYLGDVLARTQRTRQRPAWSSLERWLPVQTTLRLAPVPRMAWLVLVIALAAALAVAYVVGTHPRHLPSLFGPARNGPIVYGGTDNDIYRLDPVTGTTTALVAGSSSDSGPLLSPDGTRMLVLRGAVTDPTTGAKAGTIMVANEDGTNVRALTGQLTAMSDPAWSHDGSRIAVSSQLDGRSTLQVLNVDGSSQPVLIDTGGTTSFYLTFGAGDRELIFRGSLGATDGIFAVGVDGHGLRTIVAAGTGDYANVSPDGTKVGYQIWDGTAGSIHIADVSTGRDKTPVLNPPPGGGLVDDNPVWSPDGTQLVFVRYHGGNGYHLAVVAAAGGPVHEIGPLVPTNSGRAYTQFSPDGTSILAFFAADRSTWLLDPSGVAADRRLPTTIVEPSTWQRMGN
jgi:Tol biopolymer transport system component